MLAVIKNNNKVSITPEMASERPFPRDPTSREWLQGPGADGSLSLPQFIVAEDGSCGLVYEHAAAEGPPIIALVDHVIEFT